MSINVDLLCNVHCQQPGVTCLTFVLQDVLALLRNGASLGDKLDIVLDASFDRLDSSCKQMFLDAVSVLHGQPACRALAVWEAQQDEPAEARRNYRALKNRCLVEEDDEGRLRVHDVVRSIGCRMLKVRGSKYNEYYGSRLWMEGWKVVPQVR